MESNARTFSVAFLGFPNAGKSTLLNACLGTPLAAVSSAAGTTRWRVVGLTQEKLGETTYQVQWLDLPGFYLGRGPQHRLERSMHKCAVNGSQEATIRVLVVDVTVRERDHAALAETFDVVVLNKIDAVKSKGKLLPVLEHFHKKYPEAELVPLSAKTTENLDTLKTILLRQGALRAEPLLEGVLDPDAFTTNTERQIVQDWVRASILEGLRAELPLSTDLLVDTFEDRGKDLKIEASFWVEKDSQKPILLGKKGLRLKEAGIRAREQLSQFFEKPVHLFLHVQVKKNWTRIEGRIHELGYGASD